MMNEEAKSRTRPAGPLLPGRIDPWRVARHEVDPMSTSPNGSPSNHSWHTTTQEGREVFQRNDSRAEEATSSNGLRAQRATLDAALSQSRTAHPPRIGHPRQESSTHANMKRHISSHRQRMLIREEEVTRTSVKGNDSDNSWHEDGSLERGPLPPAAPPKS